MFGEILPSIYFPNINVGALLDISTGTFKPGRGGQMICDGGLSPFTGIVAEPNRFKTGVSNYMDQMAAAFFPKSYHLNYDNENTYDKYRYFSYAAYVDYLKDRLADLDGNPQFVFINATRYNGTDYFNLIRSSLQARGDTKGARYTTPFVDTRTGKQLEAIYPTITICDSMSGLEPADVQENMAKNDIGSKDNNMMAVKGAGAKSQMVQQINTLACRTGGYFIVTGLVGDKIELDPYAPRTRQITYLGMNLKIKNVPRNFNTQTHSTWLIAKADPLIHRETKTSLYPYDNKTEEKGNTDLNEIVMINLRNKNGLSGWPIMLVVSQAEGIKQGLTYYNFLKHNKFGLVGNNTNHVCALRPNETLSRTTVHAKTENDSKLVNALRLTAELKQLYQFHRKTFADILCSPEVLHKDLEAMGYDWERLLSCRIGWCAIEDEDVLGKEDISIVDLLNMRVGRYIPHWMNKEDRKALKLDAPITVE